MAQSQAYCLHFTLATAIIVSVSSAGSKSDGLLNLIESHNYGASELAVAQARIRQRFGDVDMSESEVGRTSGSSFCDERPGWKREFSDEFDGNTLDTQTWHIIQSEGGPGTVDVVQGLNVTACREAACSETNVKVSGGALRLISERKDARYFSGAVTTKGRHGWSDETPYRLCVRAKLPGGNGALDRGIWPAHWMLPENGYEDKCLDGGEMDIMEMINGDGAVYSTYHWLSSWPRVRCGDFTTYHKSRSHQARMPVTWSSAFHEYAVERSKEGMKFAVDGQVVLEVSAKDQGIPLSRSPFYLVLNTAIGGGWPGSPSIDTEMPVEHAIDFVRVLRKI